MYILTFDIGGTSVKYGVLDDNGKIYENGKFKTPKEDIDKLLEELVAVKNKYGYKYELVGIALSAPGAVDNKTGVIGGYSAVPCIHGFDLREKLRNATGLERISMENDANCAALAEVWLGAAKDNKDSIFMVLGSGVGGAVIKDRKIHMGAHLNGGEFGYMVLNENCENLSKLASPVEIAKKVANRKGIEEINGEQLFAMAEEGDSIAKEEINKFYFYIAAAAYNLQYAYDPEVIVIGGGISVRRDLIENIEKSLDYVYEKIKFAKVRPQLKTCMFMNDSNLIGAVYNFIN